MILAFLLLFSRPFFTLILYNNGHFCSDPRKCVVKRTSIIQNEMKWNRKTWSGNNGTLFHNHRLHALILIEYTLYTQTHTHRMGRIQWTVCRRTGRLLSEMMVIWSIITWKFTRFAIEVGIFFVFAHISSFFSRIVGLLFWLLLLLKLGSRHEFHFFFSCFFQIKKFDYQGQFSAFDCFDGKNRKHLFNFRCSSIEHCLFVTIISELFSAEKPHLSHVTMVLIVIAIRLV